MHIDGISAAGTVSRPGRSATTAPTSDAVAGDRHATGVSGDVSPTYFRSISSITPGSLAAAYKAIRAHESAAARLVAPPAGEVAGAPQSAILSGEGISAAMRAYRDVIDA